MSNKYVTIANLWVNNFKQISNKSALTNITSLLFTDFGLKLLVSSKI